DVVLDRAARQAARDGADVSVVVISSPDLAGHAGALKAWVSELRGRLRGSDLAGALSDTEIGVLLHGVAEPTAALVAARLRSFLEPGERHGAIGAIGTASVTAGDPLDRSLVEQARHAVANGGRR